MSSIIISVHSIILQLTGNRTRKCVQNLSTITPNFLQRIPKFPDTTPNCPLTSLHRTSPFLSLRGIVQTPKLLVWPKSTLGTSNSQSSCVWWSLTRRCSLTWQGSSTCEVSTQLHIIHTFPSYIQSCPSSTPRHLVIRIIRHQVIIRHLVIRIIKQWKQTHLFISVSICPSLFGLV